MGDTPGPPSSSSPSCSTNLYAVLGVDIKSTQESIRAQYLKAARTWHPDRHQGSDLAKQKFQEIVTAFEVLSDEQQRQQYDLGLLEQLDVEDYLGRFQSLILTACGLGMGSSGEPAVEDAPQHSHAAANAQLQTIKVSKRWLLAA